VKGDIDWFGKGLGLKKHNANEPCDWCPANKTLEAAMWPTNFSAHAPWKTRLRSARQWRDETVNKHILFEKLEYLSILNIEADELHVFHIGITQYYLGSLLYLLTYKISLDTPTKNLDKIWAEILVGYSKSPGYTQYSSLTLSALVDQKKPTTTYPRLKGRGSEVKNLVEPMIAVVTKFGGLSERSDQMLRGFKSLHSLNCILDNHKCDAFLPIDKALDFRKITDEFLESYTWLGKDADNSSNLCFSAAPKLHWAWHLAYRAYWLNPRRVACFLDEDFVKHMKKLASRCACGTQLHRIPTLVMEKYRYGVELDLQRSL
jgi:hypothetical protein